jgi:hypothetical protein
MKKTITAGIMAATAAASVLTGVALAGTQQDEVRYGVLDSTEWLVRCDWDGGKVKTHSVDFWVVRNDSNVVPINAAGENLLRTLCPNADRVRLLNP